MSNILHQILYFLSQKEAAATCVLSKSWRYIWSTRPNIEFNQYLFRNPKTFLPVLTNVLQVYHDQNLCIQEFRLWVSVDESHQSEWASLLDKWIPTVMRMGGLKEFDLHLHTRVDDQYDLPQVVFETLSVKYLNLYRCSLGKIYKAPPYNKLNVETLCLSHVCIEDETLRMIISCCPLIEDLKLKKCERLTTVEVNKLHNLKKFSFSKHSTLDSEDVWIEIEETPNLQKVYIRSCVHWVHHHKYFSNVKTLKLTKVLLSSKSFDYFSSNFLSLEKLIIKNCFGFRRFRLQSHTLKHFVFGVGRHISEATFDTPNMVYFNYYFGVAIPSLYFKTISSECKSDLEMILCVPQIVTSWQLKLHEMLNVLRKSEISLNISVCDWDPLLWMNFEQNIEIPHRVVVESLHFAMQCSSCICSPLLNALFRIFRPKNIELYWNAVHLTNIRRVAEFLWKSLMERDNIQNQEIIKQQSFWQQDLEEVSVVNFDERQEKWIPFQTRSFQEKQEIIRFRFQLKWRETN